MAQKSGNSKRPRNPRMDTKRGECTVKTGKKGARKTKMSNNDLIMMGKGQFKQMKPVSGPAFSVVPGREKFDEKQSKINKELGYW